MSKYIVLDNSKRATHPFRDGIGTKSYEEVWDYDNIRKYIEPPFIVLDVDTKSDAEIMLRIVEELDIKCRVMQTDRGYHFWFKSEEPWKCFVKQRLACGVTCDCKSHSKNAYVVIKKDGVRRNWIRNIPFEEVEEVPKFFYVVNNHSSKFRFLNMGDGDGRNQGLFAYIQVLQAMRFTKDEIKECIDVINQFVFNEPLPEYEIDTICRDEAFMDEVQPMDFIMGEKFSHSELGDYLQAQYRIITVNEQLYIYKTVITKKLRKQLKEP